MNKLFAILCMQAGLVSAAEPACSPVPLSAPNSDGVTGLIRAPGSYCLGQDIVRKPKFDLHAGRMLHFAGQGLLEIVCSDARPCATPGSEARYAVDLQGHMLASASRNMQGVKNGEGGLYVTIRHGRIEVPGERASNIGIDLRGERDGPGVTVAGAPCAPSEPECADVPASALDARLPPLYKDSHYLVEKMHIRAGWRGVQLGGGANVLRDNVIEVDASTAAYLFGPAAVIENNTFIIHGKGERTAFDAALKLRDAHGAVVRNNKFIFRGAWFRKAPAAINLLDAKDVLIEGNTFEGFDQQVRQNGASTFVLR